MNPEDHIKTFFQSRLKDSNPSAEEWNSPSDEIWEKAKRSFPNEDKTRRPLIFWVLGLVGIIVIGTLVFTQLSDIPTSKLTISNQTNENTKESKSKKQTTELEARKNDKIENEGNGNQATLSPSIGNIGSEINNSEVAQIEQSSNSTHSYNYNKQIDKINTRTIYSQNKTAQSSNPIPPNSNPIPPNESQGSTVNQIQLAKREPKESGTLSKDNTTSNLVESQEKSSSNLAKINSVDDLEILSLAYLPSKGISSLNNDRLPIINTDKIVMPLQKNKKWEIGISTSPLVFPIEKLVSADTLDSDLSDFKLSYVGLNIPVTRIINQKWSVTSGLYYKKGNIRARFTDEETLDIGDNFSLMLLQDSSVGTIELNNKTEEFSVNLKPDVEIIDGDIIIVNGYGKIKFRAIQVPFLVNYHIRKNKLEYLFSLGASADIINLTLSDLDISLSKENSIISDPVAFTPLSTNFLGYSLYGAIGTKYHFDERINLSYNLKVDLEDIIASTHELGIHYRF